MSGLFPNGAVIDSETIGQTTGRVALGYDGTGGTVQFLAVDSSGQLKISQQGFANRYSILTTSNQVYQTIDTIPIPAGSTVFIQAYARVCTQDSTNGAAYIRQGAFKNNGGVVTLIGAQNYGFSAEDAGILPNACNLLVSGANVLVQVQGTNLITMDWQCNTLVWSKA